MNFNLVSPPRDVRRWRLLPLLLGALWTAPGSAGAAPVLANWTAPSPLQANANAQAMPGEAPAQRVGSIVGVAVGEYAKGVDNQGHLVAADERDEATGFLTDAREVAARLPGDRRAAVTALIDTLVT